MRAKILILLGFIFPALIAPAAATIAIDRVQQRYPYTGVLDVDYTVSGRGSDFDCDYNVVLSWTLGAQSGVMTNYIGVASCDLPVANGSHRVTWNATADGVQVGPTSALSVTARLVNQVVTSTEADYIIIDLSSGPSSTDYPARYVNLGFDYSTANFNYAIYKTTKLVLKCVPAGEFWMGDGNVSSGTSRHRVRHTRHFWLGIFELTQRQYQLVMNANPSKYKTDGTTEKAAHRPVEAVNYDMIYKPDGLIARLEARATFHGSPVGGFCLPTEAQWEYCARAGAETSYYWGDALSGYEAYEWGNGNSSSMTHAVGLKKPNAWGFYDMLGNVWVWTRDWINAVAPYSATEVSEDPELTNFSKGKVMRGGTYHPSYGVRRCGLRYTDQVTLNITGAGYNPNLINSYGCRICREEP